MGESICLMRSLSQPADMLSLRESDQVAVPRCRVLTESVSFGRFASESLQWEKWSAFTQNRYLEEVERFTVPGSVAQKKAFFEAHFKSRASVKTTTKTQLKEEEEEEANVVVTTGDVGENNLLVVTNGMTMDVVSHGDVGSVSPTAFVIDATTDVKTGQVNSDTIAVPEDEALDKENYTSSGSKTCCISSKLEPSFSIELDLPLKTTSKEPLSTRQRSISVSKKQNRSPPQQLFHMPISCVPSGNTYKKIPHNGSRRSSSNAKDVGKADKKERSCLNFAPRNLARKSTTKETNARSSVKPKENKPTVASKSRKRPLSRAAKEDSDAPKCSTRVIHPPNSRPPEDKRNNMTLGSSVSCKIPNSVQRQPSASCGTRAKPFTVSSPFNFRSDERAEKRKEFFKKQEEKRKDDVNKEQLTCGFKESQNTQEHKNSQAGGFKVPMISLTSPRFLRNQTPGREMIKKTHKSPIKVASVKKNKNTRNPSMEKHKRCKVHPSQTKK